LSSILKNLRIMLTRESIIQRLLDDKSITTEEAVILLKTEVTKWLPSPDQRIPGTTSPWIGPGPTIQPYQPYTSPNTPYNPMYPQCDWTNRPETQPYYGGTTSHTGTGKLNAFAFNTNENFCAK